MDTKLRNISRHTLTKLLAFVLVVVFITSAVVQGAYVLFMEYNPETIMVDEYKLSRTEFRPLINGAFHNTLWLVEDDEIVDEEEMDTSTVPWEDSVAAEDVTEQPVTEEVNEVETEVTADSTTEEIQIINEDKEYIFYVTDGKRTFTNREDYTKEDFAKYEDAFIAYESGEVTYGKNTNSSILQWYSEDKDITMYVAFTDEFMAEQQKQWEIERETLLPIAKSFTAFVLLAIVLIIYLTVVTGRKPEDDELHLTWVDKIYTEFMLGLLLLLVFGWILAAAATGDYGYNGYKVDNLLTSGQSTAIYLLGVATVIAVSLCGVVYLALVRKLKGRRFIKDMLTYKFFHGIFHRTFDFFKSFFDGKRFAKYPLTKSLHQRQITFIIASFVLVFLTFAFIAVSPLMPLMIFPPIMELVIIYWYVKYNNKTYEEINKGFNESLEDQMKAERMKINLVTNVSHDLKTPLTSIISYVDLLSKEEDLSETARDYVNILMEKSNRLKNIVADLFDLAKSTSGDINIDLEDLDLKKLIEQTLGDMEDDIEKSGLAIKTNLPEEAVMIKSDGKKLYRVFQNIIDNALKYSLQGTRIFVDLEEKDNMAIATVKNTAGYEMDFTAEEILQRFNRGDESRTTDGSGLGLSIAESFTEVSGGNFKVDIDGDMFKVIIGFEKIM